MSGARRWRRSTGTQTRPTRGVPLALAGAAVLQLLSRVSGGAWLSFASCAALTLPVLALLLRPRLDQIDVRRTPLSRGAVGTTVQVRLEVINTGRRASPALLAEDEMPGHAALTVAVPALRPGETAGLTAEREVVGRTAEPAGVVRLSARSPVGLVLARREVVQDGEVRAHPAVVPAPAIPRPRGAPGDGSASVPLPGAGSEVLGLRSFRLGDPAGAVSARASARHGRPLVLERERELDPGLVVLIAGSGSARPEDTRTSPVRERALSEAAALATAAVRAGLPVAVLGPPGPEQPRGAHLLDAFAAADHAPPLTPVTVGRAVTRAGRGGRLVVVAPAAQLEGRVATRRQCAAIGCELVVLDA